MTATGLDPHAAQGVALTVYKVDGPNNNTRKPYRAIRFKESGVMKLRSATAGERALEIGITKSEDEVRSAYTWTANPWDGMLMSTSGIRRKWLDGGVAGRPRCPRLLPTAHVDYPVGCRWGELTDKAQLQSIVSCLGVFLCLAPAGGNVQPSSRN
jgi:hypothetical protein